MNNPVLTNNTLRVKESNTNLILESVKKMGITTRNEIARDTGLSIATCGNILKDLVNTGEILEGDLESGSGGRPARRYIYNKSYSLIIAITLHADSNIKTLQYAVANLYGEIIEESVKAYDYIDFNILDDLLEELISVHKSVKSVGIGVPGIVNNDGSIRVNDIEELNGVKLAKLLEEKHNIEVSVERSPAISAYGYYKNHPEYSGDTIATVLTPLNYPIGAGFIVNGQIYKGHFNMEGEISYIFKSFSNELVPTTDENEKFIQEVIFTIAAIVSTINPKVIVFMGKGFSNSVYQELLTRCTSLFPNEFIPEFIRIDDYSNDYLDGAIQLAMDSLKPKIKLISR